MTIADWISTELADRGLAMASAETPGAWLEATSAGQTWVIDGDIPFTPDLQEFAQEWDCTCYMSELAAVARAWDAAAYDAKVAALFGHLATPARGLLVTPQILVDVWGTQGPRAVADLLRRLDPAARNRLAVDYWGHLRASGSSHVTLLAIGCQFDLLVRLY